MKKIYARELPAEYFDAEIYMDEQMLADYDIFIGLNRDFISVNKEMYDEAEAALDHIYDDLEATDTFEDADAEMRITRDYTGMNLTADEIKTVVKAAYEFVDNRDPLGAICDYLNVVKKRSFAHRTLRGSSQGDFITCIYPIGEEEFVDWLEAVYFGTGSEWEIADEYLESVEEFEAAQKFNDYTDKWRDEDIKDWVRQVVSEPDCEVVLLKISGSHTYTKYDYEEV